MDFNSTSMIRPFFLYDILYNEDIKIRVESKLEANHGAFAIARKIFNYNLWMMFIFVLLAHSHS
jgi:hypothetical protein